MRMLLSALFSTVLVSSAAMASMAELEMLSYENEPFAMIVTKASAYNGKSGQVLGYFPRAAFSHHPVLKVSGMVFDVDKVRTSWVPTAYQDGVHTLAKEVVLQTLAKELPGSRIQPSFTTVGFDEKVSAYRSDEAKSFFIFPAAGEAKAEGATFPDFDESIKVTYGPREVVEKLHDELEQDPNKIYNEHFRARTLAIQVFEERPGVEPEDEAIVGKAAGIYLVRHLSRDRGVLFAQGSAENPSLNSVAVQINQPEEWRVSDVTMDGTTFFEKVIGKVLGGNLQLACIAGAEAEREKNSCVQKDGAIVVSGLLSASDSGSKMLLYAKEQAGNPVIVYRIEMGFTN